MEKKFSKDFYAKFNAAGYQTGDEITPVDKFLIHYALDNSNVSLIMDNHYWEFKEKKLINLTNSFFDSYFKLHDVKFFDEEIAAKIRIHNVFDLLTPEKTNEFKKYSKMINPLNLPIKESNIAGVGGIFLDNEYYNTSVDLKDLNNKLVIPSYAHEITHTQLINNKGSVINYKNHEVLPIFIELLASSKVDDGILLSDSMKKRLTDVLLCIVDLSDHKKGPDELLKASAYLESALNAVTLYDLYCNLNDLRKKEILEGIQLVFDGDKTVEDVLNRFYIDYEECSLFKSYLFKDYIK